VCISSVCETKESMDKRIIKIVRHFGNIFLLNGIGIFDLIHLRKRLHMRHVSRDIT
jgi:hypothetical protein